MVSQLKEELKAFGYKHIPSNVDGSHTFLRALKNPSNKPADVLRAEEETRLRHCLDDFQNRNPNHEVFLTLGSLPNKIHAFLVHVQEIERQQPAGQKAKPLAKRFE